VDCGLITELTAAHNDRAYSGEEIRMPLSTFTSINQKSKAACTEYAVLSHQIISLTGLASSMMISGGTLNIFELGQTTGEAANMELHNYQVISYEESRSRRFFLYDPVNYLKIRNGTATYFFPAFFELPEQSLQVFLKEGKSISVKTPYEERDYFLT